MADQDRRPHKLNWLGTTVATGGALMRLTANLIESTAHRVSTIASQSQKAFKQGRDPNVEDARIIEEYPRAPQQRDESSPAQDSSA
jgi:hypothetical protein